MLTKEDIASAISYVCNALLSFVSAILVFMSQIELSQWGMISGILCGVITAAVNVWYRRRLIKIAELNGQVKLD